MVIKSYLIIKIRSKNNLREKTIAPIIKDGYQTKISMYKFKLISTNEVIAKQRWLLNEIKLGLSSCYLLGSRAVTMAAELK